MQERRLATLLEDAHQDLPGTSQPRRDLPAREAGHLLDALYASFEDQFRGTREESGIVCGSTFPSLKTRR